MSLQITTLEPKPSPTGSQDSNCKLLKAMQTSLTPAEYEYATLILALYKNGTLSEELAQRSLFQLLSPYPALCSLFVQQCLHRPPRVQH